MISYKQIKRKLGLTDEQIGLMFGYKNIMSFKNSTGKKDIEDGIEKFFDVVVKSKIKL